MTSAHAVQTQASRVPFYLSVLVAFHIALVIASNYLVQLPITLLGFHSTWGAFSFPFIFLATDLTVRLIGKTAARRVIMRASFAAYVLGQLLDIQVFDRIRQKSHSWWLAPAAASVFGQVLDTAAFFSIAFWHSSDAFMAANWVEIAMVDYVIKLGVSLLLFVPAYGVVLAAIVRSMKVQVTPATAIR